MVCLLLAGMLRAEWAYLAGYVVQVAAIGLGFVVPVMFGLGAIFAALWAGPTCSAARSSASAPRPGRPGAPSSALTLR